MVDLVIKHVSKYFEFLNAPIPIIHFNFNLDLKKHAMLLADYPNEYYIFLIQLYKHWLLFLRKKILRKEKSQVV